MDQELSQTRITNHTVHQAIGPPAEYDLRQVTEQLMNKLQNGPPNANTKSFLDDCRSDTSGAYSPRPLDGCSNAWNEPAQFPYGNFPIHDPTPNIGPWNSGMPPAHGPGMPPRYAPQPQRPAHLRLDTLNSNFDHGFSHGFRRNNGPFGRPGSALGHLQGGWTSYPPSVASSANVSPPMSPMSYHGMNAGQGSPPYQPRPIGTPLSPTAMEFSAEAMGSAGPLVNNPWNSQVSAPRLLRTRCKACLVFNISFLWSRS